MPCTRSGHCGAVRFEIEGALPGALECHFSICERKGSRLWFVPRPFFDGGSY